MNLDLIEIQRIIVTASREELLPRFNMVQRHYKVDGSVVTEADFAMQQRLKNELNVVCQDVELLGEEMSKTEQQNLLSSGKAIWCVDPLDGTNNFSAGLPYFCVSIALIIDGKVELGIVYDPIRNDYFSALPGQGAYLNGERLTSNITGLTLNRTIGFVDYKRLPKKLALKFMDDLPYGSLRSLGSIALELSWIAAGRGHIYFHSQQQLWDYAAAQLILTEAGGQSCRLDGTPAFNNDLTPCSTLAALDPTLFTFWRNYLLSAHAEDA